MTTFKLVNRLWKFEHDLSSSEQELAAAVRDYEDRKWALHFVVEDMNKRLPEMDSAMRPKVQLKLSSAKRLLEGSAEKIVASELASYESLSDGSEERVEHPEA
ncbi:hypothetical protein [Pseudarthrobacter phenanthrenivorans]|uniref:hypothetical protein n=1 Tax=Pseudarthrobacter phenanthrenivorans TaxID=361575 RepID=UPI0012E06956|nr:hypothetical protein [Pseudarthrobacter phenanthrenivorans]